MLADYEQLVYSTALRYIDGNVQGPGLVLLRIALVVGAAACILFSLRATMLCSVLPQALLLWFVFASVAAIWHTGLKQTAASPPDAPSGFGGLTELMLILLAVALAASGAVRQRNVWFARRVMQYGTETVFDSIIAPATQCTTAAPAGASALAEAPESATVGTVLVAPDEINGGAAIDPALVQMYGGAGVQTPPPRAGCTERLSLAVTKFQVRHPSTGFGSMLLLAVAAVLVACHILFRAYTDRVGVVDAFQAAYRPGAVTLIFGLAIICGFVVEQYFPIAVVALGSAATMPALVVAAGVALRPSLAATATSGCDAVWDFVIPAVSQFCITHDRSAFSNYYYPGYYLGGATLSGSSSSSSSTSSSGSTSSSHHGSTSSGSAGSSSSHAYYYCDSRYADALAFFLFMMGIVALVAATVFYRSYVQGHRAAVRLVGLYDAEALYEARHAPTAVGGIGWWSATAADMQHEHDRTSLLAVTTQREQEVGTTMPKWARVAI